MIRAAAIASLGVLLSGAIFGQAVRSASAFEVASVKVNTAIQDQLGLKLELRKAPVDRLIIDHIDRVPTEN
ncbi:MAG TPA: TIGR03435 family protein [Bryobacteraceae bacterium]